MARGRRLRFFKKGKFDISEEVKEQLQHQENELLVISELEHICRRNSVIEIF